MFNLAQNVTRGAIFSPGDKHSSLGKRSNDAFLLQLVYFFLGVAEDASEDLFGVLSEKRRRGVDFARRFGQVDRRAGDPHLAHSGLVYLDKHVAMLDMGIFTDLTDVMDRGVREVRVLEQDRPFPRGLLGEFACENRDEFLDVVAS